MHRHLKTLHLLPGLLDMKSEVLDPEFMGQTTHTRNVCLLSASMRGRFSPQRKIKQTAKIIWGEKKLWGTRSEV